MGLICSLYTETFPPKSHFSPDSGIPDLTGKVVIVTGSNTGIGKITAKELLKHNAKVYVAARSPDKAADAIRELKEETGKEGVFLRLDLSDLNSVKAASEEFLSKEKALHILFNSAGVMMPPIEQLTAQGYDLQFGTNVLGHFYFTKLLLPALLAGAQSSPDKKARVVNTSSFASRLASGLNFNAFVDSPARKKLGKQEIYGQSKLGNAIFSNELARRYGEQGIVSMALNPGTINSEIKWHVSLAESLFLKLIVHDLPFGALTKLWAGTLPEAVALNGKYLVPWARIGVPNPVALDQALGEELWKWLEEQVEKKT